MLWRGRIRHRLRRRAGRSSIARRKQPRPAHAGDVAFLFRAMTDVWHYETALADLGFDYHTDRRLGVLRPAGESATW